jgi:hypothetical protein
MALVTTLTKRTIPLLLTLSVAVLPTNILADTFSVGAKIHSVQNYFGDGFRLGYNVSEHFALDASLNRAYVYHLNEQSSYQSIPYTFYRLGVKYSFTPTQVLSPIVTTGLELIQNNMDLTDSNDIVAGSYTTFGIDMRLSESGNIRSSIQLGTSGKGSYAKNLLGSPNFGHGFNLITELNYYF